jgi:DNA invertase Pin-like site-specific DNA recombinase
MQKSFVTDLGGPVSSSTQAKSPLLGLPLVPAAQYVRMSDEAQQYSVDNQKAAIAEYAASHGFTIVRTYADLGKSGVVAKHRTGLGELLKDVVNEDVKYKAILVYDVSRWGRFPNNDEAAHYEFLCASSGIPLHYCAEQFTNDGTASSSLMKAVKRSMAAEFSRELGDKVFRGKTRLVQLGYWVGGSPGYGFRRLMVSAEGKRKLVLKPGEQKSLTTDRVVLIPGPTQELQGVRAIFGMAAAGKGPTAIARELNRRGITHAGRPWIHQSVKDIVTNPKYMGCNTWNRHSQRLRSPMINIVPQFWVKKPLAFRPIVDQETFERAQAGLPIPRRWSKEEILKKVRCVLKRKGRLSEDIIRAVRGTPFPATILQHFGSYPQLYKELGYQQRTEDFLKCGQYERSMRLRQKLVMRIKELLPQNIIVTHLPKKSRSMLLIDRSFMVSILLCRSKLKRGKSRWVIEPDELERDYITLLCTMNASHDRVLDYYVLPRMSGHTLLHRRVSWLREGVRIRSLSDFYATVKGMWAERSRQRDLSQYLREL